MDQQIQQNLNKPDYKKIYKDMISRKYPDKISICSPILEKKNLSLMDILKMNAIISNNSKAETVIFNQRLRSYDKKTIFEILDYQKKNNLNNSQLALHFKMSRNTIAKWRKLFVP